MLDSSQTTSRKGRSSQHEHRAVKPPSHLGAHSFIYRQGLWLASRQLSFSEHLGRGAGQRGQLTGPLTLPRLAEESSSPALLLHRRLFRFLGLCSRQYTRATAIRTLIIYHVARSGSWLDWRRLQLWLVSREPVRFSYNSCKQREDRSGDGAKSDTRSRATGIARA